MRELSPGYVMKDRTLRPAKVSVTKPPVNVEEEAPSEENNEPEEASDEHQGEEE